MPESNTTVLSAIDAHRAALAALQGMDAEPDGAPYDAAVRAEEAAARALAETRCTSDDEFFAAAAAILERDIEQWGAPEHKDRCGSLAILVANRLARRRA